MLSLNKIKLVELFALTFILPTAIIILKIQKLVIPIMIIGGAFSLFFLLKKGYKFNKFLNLNKKNTFEIIIRVIFISLITFLFTYLFLHERFIFLPLLNIKLWLIITIIYPIFSVLPQEIFFRGFFFERYSNLFKNKNRLIFFNGLIFGLVHLIYMDFLVFVIATIGGVIFARNYYYNKSIFLVTLEHSMMGNIIFSIGLGHFFNHGNIKYLYDLI